MASDAFSNEKRERERERERTERSIYPKVIAQPWHQPELHPSQYANFVYDQWPPNGHEGENTSQAYLHPIHFAWSELSQIEVPVHPIRTLTIK